MTKEMKDRKDVKTVDKERNRRRREQEQEDAEE
jgi:hypothetical protein